MIDLRVLVYGSKGTGDWGRGTPMNRDFGEAPQQGTGDRIPNRAELALRALWLVKTHLPLTSRPPLPGVPGRGFSRLVGSLEQQYRHGARALSSSKNRPPPEWFLVA